MRHVIVHYHLFKNAGTTIDRMLQRNFGPGWATMEAQQPWETLAPDALAARVVAEPGLVAVSSHTLRPPLPVIDGIHWHPIVFLRHPIDRVGSVYEFERSQPADSPSLGARIARESGLRDYVAWRLQPGNGAVLRGFQTVFLSGREQDMRVAEPNDEDLLRAKEFLTGLPVFGVVENFEDSLAALADDLRPAFPGLDTRFDVENRSQGRAGSLAERVAQVEASLGARIFEQLLHWNRHDIALYDWACSRPR